MKGHVLVLFLACNALRAATYVGPQACAACHPAESAKQTATHHAHALRRIHGSVVGDVLLQQAQSPDGLLHYSAQGKDVSVTGTAGASSAIIEWAFGAGVQGSTPVGHFEDQYLEHRFSYYTRVKKLAPTFGHPRRATSPIGELGMLQDGRTISSCFNCHATGVQPGDNGPDLSTMTPGVTCERCHGPGSSHVASRKREDIVNPGRFPAKAQIEICGQCHRLPTPDMGAEPEMENPVTVRFAPVGLLTSRCFQASQGKLSCLTCHNPHEDAQPRASISYVEKCLVCHAADHKPVKLCRRRQKENCLGCHMQQASFGPYLRFTDHRIRVNPPAS